MLKEAVLKSIIHFMQVAEKIGVSNMDLHTTIFEFATTMLRMQASINPSMSNALTTVQHVVSLSTVQSGSTVVKLSSNSANTGKCFIIQSQVVYVIKTWSN